MIQQAIDSGIIAPQDLHALLAAGETGIKLVDATFVLPGSAEDPRRNYSESRIGHAVFFDLDGVCDKKTALPHMLPEKDSFAQSLSQMGIGNDDVIVIYGQYGMVMGPARLWWMLRVFGHDRVCVLDGGLPAWKDAGYALETAPPATPSPAVFTVQDERKDLVVSLPCVQSISETGECPILDARPKERFDGQSPEPRAGMRSGHIPGSVNVPCSGLVDPGTGKLKGKDDLKSVLQSCGADISPPSVIATCGSGITACMIALALFHLGCKTCRVYDGSWSEWGHENSPTIVANKN